MKGTSFLDFTEVATATQTKNGLQTGKDGSIGSMPVCRSSNMSSNPGKGDHLCHGKGK